MMIVGSSTTVCRVVQGTWTDFLVQQLLVVLLL